MTPAPADSAVEGLPDGLLRAGYRHRAAPDLSQADHRFSRGLALIAFAEVSPPRRKISESLIKRSAMAVAMVVLYRIFPHSEKAVLVVMSVLLFVAVAGGDDLIEEVGGLLVERKIS